VTAAASNDEIMHSLFREVMATWQTDEIRRTKPTPVEEAKGGLHILEQSLWTAVPAYLRKLNAVVNQVPYQNTPPLRESHPSACMPADLILYSHLVLF
jgi:phosphoenolpyruvate carboxylase